MHAYNAGLHKIINGETSGYQSKEDISNYMERYKVIGFRPESVNPFGVLVTESALRNTGYYIDIEFNDNQNDGNEIANALDAAGLWGAVTTALIESDIRPDTIPPEIAAVSTEFDRHLTDNEDDWLEDTAEIQQLFDPHFQLGTAPGASVTFETTYEHSFSNATTGLVHLYYMHDIVIDGWDSSGNIVNPQHAPQNSAGVYLSAHGMSMFEGTSIEDPLDGPDLADAVEAWRTSTDSNQGEQLWRQLMIDFEDILNGEDCYSETLVYKIEKRRVDIDGNEGDVVQTIYIPKVRPGTGNSFRYIDTQVFYGQRYKYDIKPIRVVVANNYAYSNIQVSSDLVPMAGNGHAIGNALGFYKETGGYGLGYDIARWPSGYLDEGEDTSISHTQRGRYLFKLPGQHSPINLLCYGDASDWIRTSTGGSDGEVRWRPGTEDLRTEILENTAVKFISGQGITNNEAGGVLPNQAQRASSTATPDFCLDRVETSWGVPHAESLPCTNENFEAWVHDQENAGWPNIPDLQGTNTTAEIILGATGLDAIALGVVVLVYKNLHGCLAWEYTT
jgi:hypothetical protein